MTTVVEGEVDILPPDVDTKVVALRSIDSPELQARAVTTMLSHSRTGLLAAIAAQDLPGIAQWKAKAKAIEEIAKQVRLGKDIQLDAAEFCRRAERGLGVAIREGQRYGSVATPTEVASVAAQKARGTFSSGQNAKPADTDFATRPELSGNRIKDQYGIYGMTDNVSDAQFDEAIDEAKVEGNLSRANVARKCKAKANPAPLIDENDPEIDADVQPNPPKPGPGTRPFKKSDTEMLAEIVGSLANFADLMRYIHADQISTEDINRLTGRAVNSLASIRKAMKEICNAQA